MRVTMVSRRWFLALWAGLLLAKLLLAARLPLFVDEAFYWQEGMHPAWAYSDLPALTAWLARLGTAIGGEHPLALRMPFLLLSALLPWLVQRIAAREFGQAAGWQAGSYAMLLPLAGTLGLMALPDVPMVLATLLCMDAGTRLLRGVTAGAALELALGLAIGALCHYRFIAVIGVGALALMLLPAGRQVLRDPRVIVALAFGVVAWIPLLGWNYFNAEAGLRFQLLDRHPWAFHADGAWFLLEQALLVTPLLFAALLLAAWRQWRGGSTVTRYFALLGALMIGGFFVLGFFADTERVSFHWPLPGWFALLPLLPGCALLLGPVLHALFIVPAPPPSRAKARALMAVVGVASHQAAGGRLLRCQRQIEQIGDALLDYAEAHGEQLPAPQSENELHSLLAPYLAEAGDDLWICPTGARYIPNPDLAGWYLDELDPDYDILVFETIDGESMAFPHHGYGWPKCGLFYFADGAADWLEPGDIEHDGPEDGLKLPGDAEFQPLTGPAQPRRPAAG